MEQPAEYRELKCVQCREEPQRGAHRDASYRVNSREQLLHSTENTNKREAQFQL
jgi:hypothetical protein